MSRAWQAERAAEREEAALARDLAEHRISQADYNAEMRNIQRDLQYAYQLDREEALLRVEDEWGR
jgi:hypothetical protein